MESRLKSGTADQIFNEPQHPYTQQLLGAVPKLGSYKEARTSLQGGVQSQLQY